MKKRALRKTVTLFTLLAFLGSLFPCACFAETPSSPLSEKNQTQSISHECCDSEKSKNKEDSNQSSHKGDFCCSGCNVFLAATSSDIISSVVSSPESPKPGELFFSNNVISPQVSSVHSFPRGSPPTRTPYFTSSSTIAATLCRWLI